MAIKGQCRSFPSLLLLLSLWWEESIFISLVMIIRVFLPPCYSSSSSHCPLLLFACHSEDHKAGDDDSVDGVMEKEQDL